MTMPTLKLDWRKYKFTGIVANPKWRGSPSSSLPTTIAKPKVEKTTKSNLQMIPETLSMTHHFRRQEHTDQKKMKKRKNYCGGIMGKSKQVDIFALSCRAVQLGKKDETMDGRGQSLCWASALVKIMHTFSFVPSFYIKMLQLIKSWPRICHTQWNRRCKVSGPFLRNETVSLTSVWMWVTKPSSDIGSY
jgi:hypothetical protein